ncbi:MAG: OsmC family protein [Flavobacteriales bacterium]|nr:OsmC family protein [Flavobacteriales bacterium]
MNYTVSYQGNLRTESTHLQSGTTVITDAPTDNNGKGETFSPTDLVSSGLASCMMTIVGIAAEKREIEIDEMRAEVTKKMASSPRRIETISITLYISVQNLSDNHRTVLLNAAKTCPVALSLHPDLNQELEVIFN